MEPTHEAENKKTGEKVLVEFDEKTDTYKINWMIQLESPVEKHWIIRPLKTHDIHNAH